VRKPEEEQKHVPENSFETYMLIAKARGKV
jgi:hypothetical protein